MAEVTVHATGQSFVTTSEAEADYYRGEANTVGGYTIDGAEYPRKIALSDFDPGDHTVAEVEEHLAISMPGERDRVLEAERAGQARVTLLRDYELPEGGEVSDTAAVMAYGNEQLVDLNAALGGPADAVDADDSDDHPSPKPH